MFSEHTLYAISTFFAGFVWRMISHFGGGCFFDFKRHVDGKNIVFIYVHIFGMRTMLFLRNHMALRLNHYQVDIFSGNGLVLVACQFVQVLTSMIEGIQLERG